MLEDRDGRGGIAPGCGGIHCRDGLVAVEILETGSADYGYVDWSWGRCELRAET